MADVEERGLHDVMADCVEPAGMFDAFAAAAARLEAWHRGGRVGDRPDGRLRPLPLPDLSAWTRTWARLPFATLHDPDGRPPRIRRTRTY